MNKVNAPGFTAEASLYKTSAHYQTARNAINSSFHISGAIYAAMEGDGQGELPCREENTAEGEVICVRGTAPLEEPGWN